MPARSFRSWFAFALALCTVAPAPAQSPPVVSRVAFGSCADQDKPLPIFDTIAAQKPDLLILLGDNIYADLDRTRKVTTEVIREKYEVLGKLPAWQKLRTGCPVMATWDDHDYGINDAGREFEFKKDSQALFHDFFGTPADSPRRKQEGVYSAQTFGPEGKRVQVILLDMRYFRSELKYGGPTRIEPYGMIRKPYLPQDEPGATFLGDAQWKWLEEQFRTPAEVRLLGSSVQLLSNDHPFEKWGNIPAERNKLFQLIRDTDANGVVVLSGDRHLGELSLSTDDVGYPLYDLTASGLNVAAPEWRACENNRRRVAAMPFGDHFGMVSIDWSADPTVKLELKDAAGDTALKQSVPVRLLRQKDKPKDKPGDKPKDAPKLPAGVLTPAEAAKKVGETVKVQFEVKSGRAVNTGGSRILLNSDKDFRAKANFTVVLNKKGQTGKYEKASYDTFKDKVVRASGKVTLYKDSPQIQIDDVKDLEIVEEKKVEGKKEEKK